ncbi:MAG: sulfite exporter TauE/SafE family protein [Christensenella sp.]|nr:sulfite exporter TauE/SafE family protein [Christensenella sp.]
MLYFFVGLAATLLGATIGVGGGIVIRPVLSLLHIDKGVASFTSLIVVLTMAIVALLTYKHKNVKIEVKKTSILAIGSVIGSFLGAGFIPMVSEDFINIGYIIVLICVLILVLMRDKLRPQKEIGRGGAAAVGCISGALSGFFGIGGGPFQMVALMICFKMRAKEAVVQSIFITLLTTISALTRYMLNGVWNFSITVYMIPAAVAGGILGGILNRKLKSPAVRITFMVVISGMVCMQLFTILTGGVR